MGQRVLESVNGRSRPLDGQTFGTNFHVHFRLRYTPSLLRDKFVETPMLDWHERILIKEHHKGEWWEFETNMYTHNPTSATLGIWLKRYIVAYDAAAGMPSSGKGSSKLLDKRGQPVSVKDLGRAGTGQEKADAVRSYLGKHGGTMLIEVHDVPAIQRPTGDDEKERLLRFNLGVQGGSLRLRAEQYLNVDAANEGW
jgi:hypothetical protein